MNLRTSLICAALAAAIGFPLGTSLAGAESTGAVFKRVSAPKPGARPRVTVQITAEEHAAAPKAGSTGMRDEEPDVIPEAEVLPVAAALPATPGTASKAAYDWFWDKVSPSRAASGPGRLDEAMAAISAGGVAAPRLQAMQKIAGERGVDILRSTVGTKVSPALVLAVIAVESSGRHDAVSSAGAQGLMQLMPATADRFGVKDSLSPAENIAGGVKYLDWLMGKFQNDPILVLAGYNSGEGSVRDHNGVPPFAETRDYVPKVLAAFQVARSLCATPPVLVTDGCVFRTLN
ncbi:Soluble lytic murein transglycosylase [Cribrihabitans marinus]|uniref:Soluble lytic murein transglycosylase n=1 Tax=Cribrihabitans marinus TaxID=1227549 RepID=A0A1H7B024_9RHOB|nr:lytic transglycosylase domain-containing protein [Cribrihabitans marinus]GGH32084.1 murein transglycosylase [Cribrihabitans marinus]SEJ66635.1 Soluble lytic murein transglycosylase [Cribrihabitans marinus]